jgi:hypothetical protein
LPSGLNLLGLDREASHDAADSEAAGAGGARRHLTTSSGLNFLGLSGSYSGNLVFWESQLEDHVVTVSSKRLRGLRRAQLTLGQLDRPIVHLLGMPQRPLSGGELVVLLPQQLPQWPGGDLDGISLAIRSRHGLDTR